MSYNSILVSIDGGPYKGSTQTLIESILPKINNIYVNQSGDIMEGSLDMKNNKIINLQNPIDDKDAVTKIYLENIIENKKINKDKLPDTFNGFSMADNRITNLGKPLDDKDAVTKKYVDKIKDVQNTFVTKLEFNDEIKICKNELDFKWYNEL